MNVFKLEGIFMKILISVSKAHKDIPNPSDYLVVVDKSDRSTWHLPVKKDGKPDHRHMGAAWAALHGGYRGHKYAGPAKAQAIKKLKQLYKQEGLQTPK